MDLIERQAAINTADTMLARCDTGCLQDYHDMMVESLSVLPSVEAEPVRRGRWEGLMLTSYPPKYRKQCSACRYMACTSEDYNYCPHCGAKMEVDDG